MALANRATLFILLLGLIAGYHGPVYPSEPSPKAAKPAAKKAVSAPAHGHAHWSYEGKDGPESWGKLSKEYALCAKGQTQSPIDIRGGIEVDLPELKLNYRPSKFSVVNNGHTIQVAYKAGGSLTHLGKTYQLLQIHFHLPSEEKINGKSFPMVAHLVHKDDAGNLAVIASLMDVGAENAFVQDVWNHIPLLVNQPTEPVDAMIDLNELLPTRREYFTYMGSLTTPPCSENVLWFVFRDTVQVSRDQIAVFSKIYPHNARPIQPTNTRMIKKSR